MMNLLLRNSIYSLLLAIFFLYSQALLSMTIQGRVKDGSIHWNNAIRQEGYLTLSNWQVISGLYPTKEWKPGSFLSIGGIKDGNITLTNGVSEISIPFGVVGTQYGLGDAANKFSIESGEGVFTECSQSNLSSSMAYVIDAKNNTSCVSRNKYKSKSENGYTPFQFVRPLLDLNDLKIVDAFNDPTLTKGVYTGTVTITPMYMFKSPTGSWTYRTASPIPLNISINYSGSQIFDFEVIGDGAIRPFYNIKPKTITGLTKYQVKFKGVFSEGSKINMKLLEPASGRFELLAEDKSIPDGKDKIPYSIKCKGESCRDNIFVDFNGRLLLEDGLSYLEAKTDTRLISFILEIAYKDIPRSSVESGKYSNSFTIIFESEM
ncbi:TPA: hypothetical protein ACX6Q0_003776 [Photobacterium damselae]